jgi:pimeloyl-ACP methyl ester carboxylesterase
MMTMISGMVSGYRCMFFFLLAASLTPRVSFANESNFPTADAALLNATRQRWLANGFTTRIVQINGIGIHVAEAGQGAAVVLLHGYPQSGEAWLLVAPELSKTHHVIIPDLRGMGLSEAAKSGYDLATVAEDIHELVRSMGVARVMVVGHDWGASVGAVYAMRYRDEVTRLAFLESALPGAGFVDLWNFSKPNPVFTFIPFLLMGGSDPTEDVTASLIRGRESIYLHHLWSSFTGDKQAAPFSSWASYVSEMARSGISVSSSSYYREAYVSADEVRVLLKEPLAIPVLSIAGEKGIGTKQEALVRAFAANVARCLVIPGSGHFLAEERPREVIAALKAFLGD